MSTPHNSPLGLGTQRLDLEVVCPQHAHEMVQVLSSPEIYIYIDDSPPTLEALTRRYRTQASNWHGVPESWRNWVIRNKNTHKAMGYIQATVHHPTHSAELAWVLAPQYSGQGFASEATRCVITELVNGSQIDSLFCFIDSKNEASKNLAQALGFKLSKHQPLTSQRWEQNIAG